MAALPPLGDRLRGQPEPRVSHGSRAWPGERRGLPGTRPAFPFFTPSLPKSTRRRYRNQTFCCSGLLSCRLATAGSPGKLSAPHFPILCHLWTRRGGNTFPSPAGPLCNRGVGQPRPGDPAGHGSPRAPQPEPLAPLGSRGAFSSPARRAEPLSLRMLGPEPWEGGEGARSCT